MAGGKKLIQLQLLRHREWENENLTNRNNEPTQEGGYFVVVRGRGIYLILFMTATVITEWRFSFPLITVDSNVMYL